jgi:hypothetical protein
MVYIYITITAIIVLFFNYLFMWGFRIGALLIIAKGSQSMLKKGEDKK